MVKYTDSSLAMLFIQSPNINESRIHPQYNPTGIIDKIAIHHMAGNMSIKNCGNHFAKKSTGASSTYGVGSDGSIGQYAHESQRPWTTSSKATDYRAVTIEVANDGGAPNWHVSDKAMASLIKLVIDICKRNDIKEIEYTGDKTGNLLMHKWFAATACPGPYLSSKFPYIAEHVNAKLKKVEKPKETEAIIDLMYKVQVGAYTDKNNANAMVKKLKAKGYESFIINSGKYHKVQVGAFTKKSNADALLKKLASQGFNAFVTTESGTVEKEADKTKSAFEPGDKVKLKENAPIYGSKATFQDWVYKSTLYVREIDGSRIVISTQKTGAVTGAVDKKYLTKI